MTREGVCPEPITVMLAGAAGIGPLLKIASCAVRLSNMAAAALPVSGRTTPAGARDSGGERAGCAGSIAGGVPSSVFEEHPATNARKSSRPAACRRAICALCLGCGGTG
jgi:hypothetical protein